MWEKGVWYEELFLVLGKAESALLRAVEPDRSLERVRREHPCLYKSFKTDVEQSRSDFLIDG